MSIQLVLALAFNTVLFTVCTGAFVFGGRPERLGAAINLVASGTTTALRLANPYYFAPAEAITFVIDLGVVAGFFWLGITTTRFWPIWATGFALANLFMSLCAVLLPSVPLFAYHSGLGIYAYLALCALALGTLRLPRDAEPYLLDGSRRSWLQYQRPTT
ncbi:hypothetical protein ASE90_16890 [Sphingomonas sp. Leaf67]|uniref:hypothetical protein n=1 Tax=Sphingomonas sp. Leaf67 TaxID=1736230 RepID=UPI00070132C5|nr:hypothetical protein [Sphingomonas sp. Leaf67]KQN90767.1 hypothetical protein ASE90_16890 [Sphingomonas sp. Leaf67]